MRALLLSDYKSLSRAGGPCASAAVGYHVFREGHFSASSANSMSETVSLMHQRR